MIDRKFGKVVLDRRTIVVSDIHGSLDLFLKLLKKVGYDPQQDILIIDGDVIEKGPRILDTLHYVMELDQNEHVYILNGNCEWAIYNIVYKEEYARHFWVYLNKQPYSIFHEIVKQKGIDISNYDGSAFQKLYKKLLERELSFIQHNYTALESENYLFVHAGIEQRADYQNSSLSSLLEQQRFFEKNNPLGKYIVAGHLPTSNYHATHIDNQILIDSNKKIISIDGGMSVKKISQLNALIIHEDGTMECAEVHQNYPIGIVNQDYIVPKHHHHKICWPDYEVEVLQRGEEFSLCRKISNLEELSIKNEYLYEKDGHYYGKDDYEDYMMSIDRGEEIEIIERCGNYYYVLYDHEVTWIECKYITLKDDLVIE